MILFAAQRESYFTNFWPKSDDGGALERAKAAVLIVGLSTRYR